MFNGSVQRIRLTSAYFLSLRWCRESSWTSWACSPGPVSRAPAFGAELRASRLTLHSSSTLGKSALQNINLDEWLIDWLKLYILQIAENFSRSSLVNGKFPVFANPSENRNWEFLVTCLQPLGHDLGQMKVHLGDCRSEYFGGC